ncbi:hypothetical protein [Haloquadratum walsbyi]|jgi:hypothetical protein|uniref:Uncharacterized protein n=1 Tax=Haloquadratum walsbyi J07HQW2 TaxID=1238425 RepID=U1PUL7_9EURY|nr:hypothetical protein [Haloquadratum walsbyi]ERG96071.1 MAG: hypothetical protein J07HQW2_02538 [Haloquadratum walsbyi J07HQW2]
MLLITGLAGGTGTTGTLYEPGETAPSYMGAPRSEAPYTWICDTFYQVDSGGQQLDTDDGEIRVAFDRPTVQGFEQRDEAISAAKTHIHTQFSRIGIHAEPDFYLNPPDETDHVSINP